MASTVTRSVEAREMKVRLLLDPLAYWPCRAKGSPPENGIDRSLIRRATNRLPRKRVKGETRVADAPGPLLARRQGSAFPKGLFTGAVRVRIPPGPQWGCRRDGVLPRKQSVVGSTPTASTK